MHMANELLSAPVAVGTIAAAAGSLWAICRKAKQFITPDKFALMGVMGAFVFAAQMVNFQLPLMPGTSGHMVGAVLLAIVLGPHLGTIVISSVVIVQCLIFQDGGLLALGCNLINMAIVPSYVGYWLYNLLRGKNANNSKLAYIGGLIACIAAIETGAVLVPIQAAVSGVLSVPFATFLTTMLGVHLLVGIVEGVITIAVLGYLHQVRPDILVNPLQGKTRLSISALTITLAVFAVVIAGGVSLLASSMPDGLEWSYAERPDQPGFNPIVENQSAAIEAVDSFHTKYAPMPDYEMKNTETGWPSFVGIIGSLLTMATIYIAAKLLNKKNITLEPVR